MDQRSEREKFHDRILVQFTKEMKKKRLYAAGFGGGCTKDKKINLISATLDYYESMNVETARILIVESTEVLMNLISSDPKNAKYFEAFPPPVDIILIGILGRNEPKSSNDEIDLVRLAKGNVVYKIDNKEPQLPPYITIHEETFEEAQKKLIQQSEKHE